jgi:hypothetical protein
VDRIGNNSGLCTRISAQMSDMEASPARRDAISRAHSGERTVVKVDNCFSIGDGPIVDLINREQRHLQRIATFRRFENFMKLRSANPFPIQVSHFHSFQLPPIGMNKSHLLIIMEGQAGRLSQSRGTIVMLYFVKTFQRIL